VISAEEINREPPAAEDPFTIAEDAVAGATATV
jgi:hypothetical protein